MRKETCFFSFISHVYFLPSHIEIALFVSPQGGVTYLLYFGYMGMLSLAILLVTGSVGFLASLWFTKTIYGSIKAPHSLQTRLGAKIFFLTFDHDFLELYCC